MSREVRRVPKDWCHPKKSDGNYISLLDSYCADIDEFREKIETDGLERAIEYFGGAPIKRDYMLADVPDSERTHYMMYETTSEGTPISPAFETPEELAHWLADNKASAFADNTADYDHWLRVCKGGYAPSAIFTPDTGFISGVQGID